MDHQSKFSGRKWHQGRLFIQGKFCYTWNICVWSIFACLIYVWIIKSCNFLTFILSKFIWFFLQVFGSNNFNHCENELEYLAKGDRSDFVEGKELKNHHFYYCYGIVADLTMKKLSKEDFFIIKNFQLWTASNFYHIPLHGPSHAQLGHVCQSVSLSVGLSWLITYRSFCHIKSLLNGIFQCK